MKNIILLLALGFFTFSATSLIAQAPKVTNVKTQEVKEEPTRICGIKKPAKGQILETKGHVKCTTQSCTKTGKCAKGCEANGNKKALHSQARNAKAVTGKLCCAEKKVKKLARNLKAK